MAKRKEEAKATKGKAGGKPPAPVGKEKKGAKKK